VMLGTYGETLVVDWGLAKTGYRTQDPDPSNENNPVTQPEPTLRPSAAGSSAPTENGPAVGTPAYMPPEQAEGKLNLVGPSSDVYSLGGILYELLTGRAPFGGHPVDVLEQVRKGEFQSPRKFMKSVPSALDAICLKAMALTPLDRYPT